MAISKIFLFAVLLNTVFAAPQFNPSDAVIVLQENDFNGIDPWHWRYETSNGIRQEQFGAEGDGSRVRGSFSWQPQDAGGATYSVSYEADENGYRPRVSFGTGYETSNGIRQEHFGTEGDGSRVRGSFSWQPQDAGGATYSVSYEADENGYRPRVAFGTGPLPVQPAPLPPVPNEPQYLKPVPQLGSNTALSLIG